MTREERILKYIDKYETPVIFEAIIVNIQPINIEATKAAVIKLVDEGFLRRFGKDRFQF